MTKHSVSMVLIDCILQRKVSDEISQSVFEPQDDTLTLPEIFIPIAPNDSSYAEFLHSGVYETQPEADRTWFAADSVTFGATRYPPQRPYPHTFSHQTAFAWPSSTQTSSNVQPVHRHVNDAYYGGWAFRPRSYYDMYRGRV